ncbi:MAG TPA: zinc ribbon domain-containing protein [Candidatus Avimonas sp.]|nr:zinc ribbon domain-containing protein [Clostridiales bacterium]HPU58247.1 zinc ribbon domain-containing protein [Candidatus Avimonas sp.]
MATIDDVISKAKTVAEAAGKKTSEFIEITKLRIEIAEQEREMASIFEGLGRLVYDSKKSGEDATSLIDECVDKIDECQNKINDLKRQIDEYRFTLRCKECGTPNPDDALYCKKCGVKMD